MPSLLDITRKNNNELSSVSLVFILIMTRTCKGMCTSSKKRYIALQAVPESENTPTKIHARHWPSSYGLGLSRVRPELLCEYPCDWFVRNSSSKYTRIQFCLWEIMLTLDVGSLVSRWVKKTRFETFYYTFAEEDPAWKHMASIGWACDIRA